MKKLIAILLVMLIFTSATLAVSANGSENLQKNAPQPLHSTKTTPPLPLLISSAQS